MDTYKFQIVARLIGAQGIAYPISASVEADNQEAAISKLYETYEHISIKSINGKPYKIV